MIEMYRDEVTKTSCEYPANYKAKDIREQLTILTEIFELDPTNALEFANRLPKIPYGFQEGWFAIPKVSAIARRFFPHISKSDQMYCEAVKVTMEKLKSSRGLRNNLEECLTMEKWHLNERTVMFIDKLNEQQKGDIFIVEAQHGIHHRGTSVRRAYATFEQNEFALGLFHVGCMALVHPERYCTIKGIDLGSDCGGDEISEFPHGNGIIIAPMLFTDGILSDPHMRIEGRRIDSRGGDIGCVTAYFTEI